MKDNYDFSNAIKNPYMKKIYVCPTDPSHQVVRFDRWDAYCCRACDVWLEGQCSDPTCPHCPGRPETPSRAVRREAAAHEDDYDRTVRLIAEGIDRGITMGIQMGQELKAVEAVWARPHPDRSAGLNPNSVTLPWEHVQEYMDVYHYVPEQLGLTEEDVARLKTGEGAITPKLAIRLEQALERPSKFWLQLEANYRIGLVEGKKQV